MNYQQSRELRFAERRIVVAEAIDLATVATSALAKKLRRANVAGTLPRTIPSPLLLGLLKTAYRYQLRWRKQGMASTVSKVLREGSDRWIDWRSGHFLILLRAALPEIDAKRCSKWAAALDAADYFEVPPSQLLRFLDQVGGIEGAARKRAELWRTVEDGEWARRSLPQRRFKRLRPAKLTNGK